MRGRQERRDSVGAGVDLSVQYVGAAPHTAVNHRGHRAGLGGDPGQHAQRSNGPRSPASTAGKLLQRGRSADGRGADSPAGIGLRQYAEQFEANYIDLPLMQVGAEEAGCGRGDHKPQGL